MGETLPSNLDDLSSDPWNPSQNSDMVACICIPDTPMVGWDADTGELPGQDPASHKVVVGNNKFLKAVL